VRLGGWFCGGPIGVVGLVLGILGRKSAGKGLATAGIILSAVGLLLTVIFIILGLIFRSSILNSITTRFTTRSVPEAKAVEFD